MRRCNKLLTYALGASTAVMAACLLSACGSSSSQGSTSASGAQPSTSQTSTKANRDVVTDGSTTQQPLHGTGGDEANDDNPGHADSGDEAKVGKNPCALVPKAEAQTILGGPISTPVEAPLGPTCIYTATGPKRTVTVSVEGVDFKKIKPHIHMRARFAVGGRPAYCGIYGQSATFVPLAGGGVLNVTAPCAIGRRFAEQAMARL
jgi:hypothetical protein